MRNLRARFQRWLLRIARQVDVVFGALRCVGCGCTDRYACPGGCEWVSVKPPLCSSCAAEEPDRW